MSFTIKIIILE